MIFTSLLNQNKEDFAFVREIVCYVVVNLRERRLKEKFLNGGDAGKIRKGVNG